MGWSIRRSIKLGKHLRLNFSKSGIGISTGVKGATVSVSKRGVRASVGKGGIRYSKNISFKSNNTNKSENLINENIVQPRKSIIQTINENSKMVQNHTEEEIKEFKEIHYTRHIKLLIPGFILVFIGLAFPPIMIIGAILLISGLICMLKNWKRINSEYKVRINK